MKTRYPWLSDSYKEITSLYKGKYIHHAVLLHNQVKIGKINLCYDVVQWIFCQQPRKNECCHDCQNCKLIESNNYPDFHLIKREKNQKNIEIDNVQSVISKMRNTSYHGRIKIMLLYYIEELSESAVHALLKIIDEPPKDSYFFLISRSFHSLSFLRSRCICLFLPIPNEEISLQWLKNTNKNEHFSSLAALRLCSGSPLSANYLLRSDSWKRRKKFHEELKNAVVNKDFLVLLPILLVDQDNQCLHWILYLLFDTLKWKQGARDTLINIDNLSLVDFLSKKCTDFSIHLQWKHWLTCIKKLKEAIGVNRELLFTYYLLNWKNMYD